MASMTFDRTLNVSAAPDVCWAVLTDVPRLVGWVTVVDSAQEIAHLAKYTAVLLDRLGPFKLRADLDISVSDVEVGRQIHIVAAGEDRQVSSRIAVAATLTLRPREPQGSVVAVDGHYDVVGRVATLGAGMIKQKAAKILDEFFSQAAIALGGELSATTVHS